MFPILPDPCYKHIHTTILSVVCVAVLCIVAPEKVKANNPKPTPDIIRKTQKLIRICTRDINHYQEAAVATIPTHISNDRTETARQNQKNILEKTEKICGSVDYWIDIYAAWSDRGEIPSADDKFLTERVLYSLDIQIKHVRKAYNTFNRVSYEEVARLERERQIQKIFEIRKKIIQAKRDNPVKQEQPSEIKNLSFNTAGDDKS